MFGLIRPFHIDNGELDGLTPQECFILGYELAEIDLLLKRRKSFTKLVHAENYQRVKEACIKAKRNYYLTWFPEDESETWLTLVVK